MTSRFCLVLIKPSYYHGDGYVIQWLRSVPVTYDEVETREMFQTAAAQAYVA